MWSNQITSQVTPGAKKTTTKNVDRWQLQGDEKTEGWERTVEKRKKKIIIQKQMPWEKMTVPQNRQDGSPAQVVLTRQKITAVFWILLQQSEVKLLWTPNPHLWKRLVLMQTSPGEPRPSTRSVSDVWLARGTFTPVEFYSSRKSTHFFLVSNSSLLLSQIV